MKVMVIDDSEIEVFVSSRLLNGSGLPSSILSFLEARDAIQHIRQHCDSPDLLPDFILLDIHMPLMNGFEFIREFEKIESENLKKIGIYILSSTGDPNDLKHSLQFNSVKDIFTKPLDVDKLIQSLKRNRVE